MDAALAHPGLARRRLIKGTMDEKKGRHTRRTSSRGIRRTHLSFVQIRTFVRTHAWQTRTDGRDHG